DRATSVRIRPHRLAALRWLVRHGGHCFAMPGSAEALPSVVVVAFILQLAACARESAAPPANPPRLAFAALRQNVGEIEAGSPMQRDFAFANRGGSDLTIDKLRTACDCTATLEGERVVPPGGSGGIYLQCDTTSRSGRQRHTVSVYTNDPTTPVVVVRMI